MQHFDVTIVGGGPVGCFIATQLAKKGISTAVFEEHQQIGKPMRCAGLVAPRIFQILNVKPEPAIQNRIYGAHIHSPDDLVMTVGGDKVKAVVIDRCAFDAFLGRDAIQRGAKVFLSHKMCG